MTNAKSYASITIDPRALTIAARSAGMSENGNSERVCEETVRSHRVEEAKRSIVLGMYEHPGDNEQMMDAIFKGVTRDMEVNDG